MTDDIQTQCWAIFQRGFEVSAGVQPDELRRAALTSCALHRLVANHGLGSLAYYYEGQPGSDHEDIVTSVIAGNTLLTADHVPVAGEFEVKNVPRHEDHGSFRRGRLLLRVLPDGFRGRRGPARPRRPGARRHRRGQGAAGAAAGLPRQARQGTVDPDERATWPGDAAFGAAGPRDGTVKLLVAKGEAAAARCCNIGNTNSRYRFPIGARRFVNDWAKAGPSHHCAIGTGHIADKIENLATLLGIGVIAYVKFL